MKRLFALQCVCAWKECWDTVALFASDDQAYAALKWAEELTNPIRRRYRVIEIGLYASAQEYIGQ